MSDVCAIGEKDEQKIGKGYNLWTELYHDFLNSDRYSNCIMNCKDEEQTKQQLKAM